MKAPANPQPAGAVAPEPSSTSDAGTTAVTAPRLELVTRAGCHLCDDARAVVEEVAGGLGLPWHEVNIDGNAELVARYGEEIPVVLVDGIQRDFWHIDPVRLRSILSRATRTA